jgi:hypothetical protein
MIAAMTAADMVFKVISCEALGAKTGPAPLVGR